MQTIGYIAAGMILLPVLAVSLLGWGSLMGKLCRISFMEETAREEKILMGFFLLYFLTGSWNFFFPVGALFTTLFITAGTILTFFFRKEIKWKKK